MSNIRKLLAVAIVHGDLSQSDVHETGADRIGALAHSDPLGAALQRLRWANDAAVFKRATLILAHRVCKKHPLDKSYTRRVCEIALEEWLLDKCDKCGGCGHMVIEGTPHAGDPCTKCEGTGKRRHSDINRMEKLGVARGRYYAKTERIFSTALMLVSEADSTAVTNMRQQLGHGVAQDIRALGEDLHGVPQRISDGCRRVVPKLHLDEMDGNEILQNMTTT